MGDDRERALQFLESAAVADQAGEPFRAVAELEKAVARQPKVASWQHRLGVLRQHCEDWSGAVVAFEAAAELDPCRASRFYRLGSAKELLWDLEGANDAYEQAVTMAPHREAWVRTLARVRRERERFRPFRGRILAHRGSARGRPENSPMALTHLPEVVSGVEIDVRLSQDGVAVLMHDSRVDRTSSGSGLVEELSYAELSGFSGQEGVGIPTLAEYLGACEGRNLQPIIIDAKSATIEALVAIASVIRVSAVAEECITMVRSEAQMNTFREVSKSLRMGAFGTNLMNVKERISAALENDAELLLVAHGDARYLANRKVVSLVQEAGLLAGASTINTRAALEAARVDNCDLLLTDKAEQLSYFVGSENKPRLAGSS